MNISMIAAVGKNNELGKDNKLIWYLPQDLKFFKNITTGHTIIMGRKTFESLPRMLPNRKHIVFSSRESFPEEVEAYKDIKSFIDKYGQVTDEMFIIGGETIYKEFMSYANKLYLTEIEKECLDADAYFPIFDKDEWQQDIIDNIDENSISYRHVLYKRVK